MIVNRTIQMIYGQARSLLLFFIGFFLRGVGNLVIFRAVGGVVAVEAGILALVHDMDILRIEANADVRVNRAVIRGLNEPLEALEIDNGVVVDALEGDGGDGAAQMALLAAGRCPHPPDG